MPSERLSLSLIVRRSGSRCCQVELSGAVAQLVHTVNASLVQHGDQQIGQRRAVGSANMLSALDTIDTTGDQQDRQIHVEMQVGARRELIISSPSLSSVAYFDL
jgi:hypothetical protein